ncbi:hypothetical protein Sjap_004640 [Stephania japonica]|uniref:Uncharacterized protein n=1 Tax=Stephania japonica TaxID=461633 RepID=A0AAP0K4U0_9MAGN
MGTIFNLVGLNGYAPSERELLRQRASGAVMSVAFLYEASYGSSDYNATKGIIGISQPRHIAVLAMAKRVAYELDLHLGKEVGFQIKHDRRVRSSCSIKFMTDKILLCETQVETTLEKRRRAMQLSKFLYEAGYGSSDFNATKGIIALDDLLVVGYNSNGGGAYDVNTVLRLISHCLDSDDLLYQVGKDVAESLQYAFINRGLNL